MWIQYVMQNAGNSLKKKLAFLAHTTIIHPDDYDDYVIVVGIKFR